MRRWGGLSLPTRKTRAQQQNALQKNAHFSGGEAGRRAGAIFHVKQAGGVPEVRERQKTRGRLLHGSELIARISGT